MVLVDNEAKKHATIDPSKQIPPIQDFTYLYRHFTLLLSISFISCHSSPHSDLFFGLLTFKIIFGYLDLLHINID